MEKTKKQSEISLESFVTIAVVFGLFGYIAKVMGLGNMFNTLMKTAHDLLLNTVFFIMAIAVLTGALSKLLSEFGVIALINKIISPIMKPLYNLPGAAALGILTTFLSDNPAIIGLAKDKGFAKYSRIISFLRCAIWEHHSEWDLSCGLLCLHLAMVRNFSRRHRLEFWEQSWVLWFL